MKHRNVLVAMILCCLLSVTATAQQDPRDGGAADSIFMDVIGPIVEPGGPAQLRAELYFFNDVQNVVMAGVGFSWDNPGLVMDSAVFSDQAKLYFNLFTLCYYRNSVDSSNHFKRFQFVAGRLSGDGLAPSVERKLMCTYFFHYEAGTENDTTCFHQEDFNYMSFVDLARIEYIPVWRGTACAEAEEPSDTIFNPVNGHTYEYVKLYRDVITWHEAKLLAELRGGYLATITGPIEAGIVVQLLDGIGDEAWLGGTDEAVEGVWTWVTGEPWDYTDWYPGEPNAAFPDEDYLLTQNLVGGRWIDAGTPQQGYIIEYGDVTPDPLINLVQWPVSEGGNGHWYGILFSPMDWFMADTAAAGLQYRGIPGHLATVTSEAENLFLMENVLPAVFVDSSSLPLDSIVTELWLGGYDDTLWSWVTGEPWTYSNFLYGGKSADGVVQALAIIGYSFCETPPMFGKWVGRDPYCDFNAMDCKLSVVEFSQGPIHPPRVLQVPREFETIQMAIDSARDFDEVLVAPGTYHESINFKGKSIVVQSSHGPLATVITNERLANLVTFDHGETHAAKLEGFTLQGGWIAVLCVGSGPTVSHCLCVEQNVWNWAAIGICGSFDTVDDPTGDPRLRPRMGPAPIRLINNTIVHGANGGISSFSSVAPEYRNNIVAFNSNYGIHQQQPDGQPQPILGYNDVFDNGSGVWPTVNYINIPDPGPGSISANPMFGRGYSLLPESPCIDAGDPNPMYVDPDGSRNDMGAVYHGLEPGGVVIPTNEWIVAFCEGSGYTLPVEPPVPPMLIQAFDPDGVLCGQDWIQVDGMYGFMPIYRDDSYTDVDEGAEPGDLISFRINGQDVTAHPPVYWTAHGDVFEVCDFSDGQCLDIPLHAGWNLISWNVAYQGDIYEALADIIDCIDVVFAFEGDALTFDPGLDMFNTLDYVDYYHGYWVRSQCETTLRVCGHPISPYEWIPLESGWNLISYWPPEAMPVEDAFYLVLNHIRQAMGFDHGAQVWLPGMLPFNTLTEFRPLSGYWAKAEYWLQLTYPGFNPPDCTSFDDGYADRGTGSASLSVTEASRTWMSVYGDGLTIDGTPVADGAAIEFLGADDLVCGRAVYANGLLKFTPVYGLDESGETSKLYPKEGDAVAISIDGTRVYPDLSWVGNGARVRLDRLSSNPEGLPTTYVLEQNYPNPFNPDTRIGFGLPEDGHVTLAIFNVLGQKVRTVTDRHYPAGNYEVEWDSRDDSGDPVSTGVYFYRLTTGDESFTKKMMLLK